MLADMQRSIEVHVSNAMESTSQGSDPQGSRQTTQNTSSNADMNLRRRELGNS